MQRHMFDHKVASAYYSSFKYIIDKRYIAVAPKLDTVYSTNNNLLTYIDIDNNNCSHNQAVCALYTNRLLS